MVSSVFGLKFRIFLEKKIYKEKSTKIRGEIYGKNHIGTISVSDIIKLFRKMKFSKSI